MRGGFAWVRIAARLAWRHMGGSFRFPEQSLKITRCTLQYSLRMYMELLEHPHLNNTAGFLKDKVSEPDIQFSSALAAERSHSRLIQGTLEGLPILRADTRFPSQPSNSNSNNLGRFQSSNTAKVGSHSSLLHEIAITGPCSCFVTSLRQPKTFGAVSVTET